MGALRSYLGLVSHGLDKGQIVIVSGNIKQVKVQVRPNRNKTSCTYTKKSTKLTNTADLKSLVSNKSDFLGESQYQIYCHHDNPDLSLKRQVGFKYSARQDNQTIDNKARGKKQQRKLLFFLFSSFVPSVIRDLLGESIELKVVPE